MPVRWPCRTMKHGTLWVLARCKPLSGVGCNRALKALTGRCNMPQCARPDVRPERQRKRRFAVSGTETYTARGITHEAARAHVNAIREPGAGFGSVNSSRAERERTGRLVVKSPKPTAEAGKQRGKPTSDARR